MQKIAIVFATDNNFILQTFVAIASILKNRKENYFADFYILIADHENPCSSKYEQKLNKKFQNFSINFQKVQSELFATMNLCIKHITLPTYYRLMIPEVLKQYDKCIYLDGDIVICGDIIQLYQYDLQGCAIAGVKMSRMAYDNQMRRQYAEMNIFKTLDTYINAGVLLMDLKKLREQEMTKKFMKCAADNSFPMQDQDVINVCCNTDIAILPYRFNVLLKEYATDREIMGHIYGREEVERAYESPFLIHYADPYTKPWKNIYAVLTKEWWEILPLLLCQEEIDNIRENAKRESQYWFYSYVKKICEEAKEIVIFGLSKIGINLYHRLKNSGISNIVAFCDNAEEKQSEYYDGIPCCSVDDIVKKWKNAVIVNTSQKYYDEIQMQLESKGIKSSQIVRYHNLPEYFYQILREDIRNELEKNL